MEVAAEQLVVIDDDAAICMIVERNLKATNWALAYFTDGLKGLEYLSTKAPEVLLVDIRMPQIDGDQLLEELAADNNLSPRTSVLVSSSVNPPPSIWRRFEKFGATFVSKDTVTSKADFLGLLKQLSHETSTAHDH